jgi:tetratricopeptide (TPR) repeat protein
MMEQAEVVPAPGVAIQSVKLALSSEARASLEAVRVAQESARERARRQTVQARLWFAIVLGALGLVAVLVGPRIARLRASRAKPVATARPAAIPSAPVTTAPAMSAAAPVVVSAPDNVMRDLDPWAPPPPVTEPAPAAGKSKARGVGGDEGCDARSIRHAPWRLSPEACMRAFQAKPDSAALAMATAHAFYGRSRLAEAAQWGKRALALNPKAAEAYVMIARDELANGRQDSARAAYGRYLEVAPRGWHQAEARAALRLPAGASR